MLVILLKSVPKLGKADDVIDVPDGYAANALFPKKLAVRASQQAVQAVQQKKHNKVTQKEIQHNLLDRAIASLEGKSLVYTVKASEKGSLFQKIDVPAIAKALLEQHRITIDTALMTIREGHIKHTGTYNVDIVEGAYKAVLPVIVQGEK
jgi:large subunit ribosomal protein L9